MTQEPEANLAAPQPAAEIVSAEDVKKAASFISLAELCLAMSTHTYSAQEEIGALIEQAKDNKNPTQQLAAIKVLHARRMEALKNSGAIVTVNESATGPDGVHRTLSTNIVAHALRRNVHSQPIEETHHAVQEEETKDQPGQREVPPAPEHPGSGPEAPETPSGVPRPATGSDLDSEPEPDLNLQTSGNQPGGRADEYTGPRPILDQPPSDAIAKSLPGLASSSKPKSGSTAHDAEGEGGLVQRGQ